MATLKELMGDLNRGDGRRFFSHSMLISNELFFEPIFKDHHNVWYGLDDRGNSDYFPENDADDWKLYMKPNEKKKVKLYRPIYLDTNRVSYGTHSKWESNKSYFYDYDFQKIVGWQEMEVEVDE